MFIVAADQEVLELAMKNAPQAKPVRENEPYYSTTGALLDKIFQHQLRLPPIRPEALTNLPRGLPMAGPKVFGASCVRSSGFTRTSSTRWCRRTFKALVE